jgi:hypothetical protein
LFIRLQFGHVVLPSLNKFNIVGLIEDEFTFPQLL